MDDRTIVTNDEETLDRAIAAWQQYAGYIHLLESPSKMQRIDLTKPRGLRRMEVLGTTVGLPGRFTFDRIPKHKKRLDKAMYTTKRVGMLPLKQQTRITSLCVFAKTKAAYGWINGDPSQGYMKYSMTPSTGELRASCVLPRLRKGHFWLGQALRLRCPFS